GDRDHPTGGEVDRSRLQPRRTGTRELAPPGPDQRELGGGPRDADRVAATDPGPVRPPLLRGARRMVDPVRVQLRRRRGRPQRAADLAPGIADALGGRLAVGPGWPAAAGL